MADSTMNAKEKARRREERNKELARRKETAEKAVKKTTGLLSGAVTKIQKMREKRKKLMEQY